MDVAQMMVDSGGRIFWNVHAQRVDNTETLLQSARDIQPKWGLVMDGVGLCEQLMAQAPHCNMISRIYPDENWSNVHAKDWIRQKESEIGGKGIWAYGFNEVGYDDAYIQLNIDIIKGVASGSTLRGVVIGNMSVGTPEPADWAKPKSLELLRLLDQHREIAVLGLHEYACGVITSGFLGGYPDNAGVQPGTPGGKNLIPVANWPSDPYPCYHMGRFKFLLEACQEAGINPPRIVLTEHGFDDVSDIKPWSERLIMTEPYTSIRGWKSCWDQWRAWWPQWTDPQEAYYEQLAYADRTLYQNSPVEAQLIFCWGS